MLCGYLEKKTIIESKEDTTTEFNSSVYEEINIEFIFNSMKPSFGELYLITGSENKMFPPENRQFEKLNSLGISFIDGQYYGIKNENKIGDGVTLWLFALKNGEIDYVDLNAPFDSIVMEYKVLSNQVESAKLVKKVFFAFKDNLNVTIVFEGEIITDYKVIEDRINRQIKRCRKELNVEPGTEEALKLVWGQTSAYDNSNN